MDACEELRKDPEVVKVAVMQNGMALQHALGKAKEDPEVSGEGGEALYFASGECRRTQRW